MGFTFKENCPDVRNTRVIDIVKTLEEYNANVTILDSWADPAIAKHEYGIELHNNLPVEKFDAIILAVAHDIFKNIEIAKITNDNRIVYNVKGALNPTDVDGKL